jgi:hypothetical protein
MLPAWWMLVMATEQELLNYPIAIAASTGSKVELLGSNWLVNVCNKLPAQGWSRTMYAPAVGAVVMKMERVHHYAETDGCSRDTIRVRKVSAA